MWTSGITAKTVQIGGVAGGKMPERSSRSLPENFVGNLGARLCVRRAHTGAVYRHGQLLAFALRALQPTHHLVIRHVACSTCADLFAKRRRLMEQWEAWCVG